MKTVILNHRFSKLILVLGLIFSFNTFATDKDMNKMEGMEGMEHKNMDMSKMKGMENKNLNMNKMHTMMKECMAKQEDDKLCHSEIMKKCENGMSMNKCEELMNSMKK